MGSYRRSPERATRARERHADIGRRAVQAKRLLARAATYDAFVEAPDAELPAELGRQLSHAEARVMSRIVGTLRKEHRPAVVASADEIGLVVQLAGRNVRKVTARLVLLELLTKVKDYENPPDGWTCRRGRRWSLKRLRNGYVLGATARRLFADIDTGIRFGGLLRALVAVATAAVDSSVDKAVKGAARKGGDPSNATLLLLPRSSSSPVSKTEEREGAPSARESSAHPSGSLKRPASPAAVDGLRQLDDIRRARRRALRGRAAPSVGSSGDRRLLRFYSRARAILDAEAGRSRVEGPSDYFERLEALVAQLIASDDGSEP